MASDHPADGHKDARNKPTKLTDFIGLIMVIHKLHWMINGSRKLGRPLAHLLLAGAPGTGKTTLSAAIAAEMGVTFVEVAADATPSVLIERLLALKDDDVLYIDEAHLLRPKCYDILNKALIEQVVPDASTGEMQPTKRFTLICSTNRVGELNKAFRSRLRQIDIPRYTRDERIRIAERVAAHEGITFGEGAADRLARVSATPRLVEERVRAVAERYPGAAEVTHQMMVDFIRDDLEIDNRGLTPPYRHYLQLLAGRKGVRMSQSAIVAALGMGAAVVKNEIEPELLRLGLVEVPSEGGRILTPEGQKAARWKAGGAS